jgi:hypothetical protein
MLLLAAAPAFMKAGALDSIVTAAFVTDALKPQKSFMCIC